MSVKLHIHTSQQELTNGQEAVETRGRTVGECVRQLVEQFPRMEKALFAKKDKLHPFVEVYINNESAFPNELARPVKDGDDVYLTVMLAGG